MAILLVGAFEVKRGIKYDGVVPNGNAFRLTKKVRLSINKSAFVAIPVHENILTKVGYTYVFEDDSTILLLRETTGGLNTFYSNLNDADIPLTKNIEATAVELTAPEAGTTCDVHGSISFDNTISTQTTNVTLRLKNGSTVISTVILEIVKASKSNMSITALNTSISLSDILTLTVEADNDSTVRGSDTPSVIQYEIKA